MTAARLEETSQHHSIHIRSQADEIWRELMRTERIRPFYLSTILRAEFSAGASIVCVSSAGLVRNYGRVLEVSPPHCLRRSFNVPASGAPESELTWRLVPGAEGTSVVLDHHGIARTVTLYAQLSWVWPQILNGLREHIEVFCRTYPRDWPVANPFHPRHVMPDADLARLSAEDGKTHAAR